MNVGSSASQKVQSLINFISSLEPLEKTSSKPSPPSPLHKKEILNAVTEQKSSEFPNYIYDPLNNNLEKELLRLQSVYGTDYTPLIPRQFVYAKEEEKESKKEEKKGGRRLRIMQFNLLADGLSNYHTPMNLFFDTPRESLDFK